MAVISAHLSDDHARHRDPIGPRSAIGDHSDQLGARVVHNLHASTSSIPPLEASNGERHSIEEFAPGLLDQHMKSSTYRSTPFAKILKQLQ